MMADSPRLEDLRHPLLDGMSYAEQRQCAKEIAAASWRIIGVRPVKFGQKWPNDTLHALRTQPRGYGKRRRFWQSTTECGQIMLQGHVWQWRYGRLHETTCLSCRRVVRERFEQHEIDDIGDDIADAYDRQFDDTWWRVQEAWHKPDPPRPAQVSEIG